MISIVKPQKIRNIEDMARVVFNALPSDSGNAQGLVPLWWTDVDGDVRVHVTAMARNADLHVGDIAEVLIISEGSIHPNPDACLTPEWSEAHFKFVSANVAHIQRHFDAQPAQACFHGLPRPGKGKGTCGGMGGGTCAQWYPSCCLTDMNHGAISVNAQRRS